MRRARIQTTHEDSETATRVAMAVSPDNTDEMETVADGRQVTTTIERATTGGLQTNVDDYVVNLTVAAQLSDQDGDPSINTTQDT